MNFEIAKNLLERYFDGKDNNKPEVIENLFTSEGVVTFDIVPDTIKFPARIEGAKNISAMMFADFHDNFDNISSYYIVDEFHGLDEHQIASMDWLVVMRERKTGLFRLGTGSYHWEFGVQFTVGADQGVDWKVSRLDIYIHDMFSFPEHEASWIKDSKSQLPYPWLALDTAVSELAKNKVFAGICAYLTREQKTAAVG